MEDKIEINEYVRTPLGIAKYLGECDDMQNFYEFDKLDEELWFSDIANVIYQNELDKVILKHSPNIIDLIKVGDLIVTYPDISMHEVIGKNNNYIETLEDRYVTLPDIKEIVTKEQIEKMKYKL